MRMARDKGNHDVMQHLAESLGYADPMPIEPRDELADLLRQTIESQRDMARRQERIERLLTSTHPALDQRQHVRAA